MNNEDRFKEVQLEKRAAFSCHLADTSVAKETANIPKSRGKDSHAGLRLTITINISKVM